MKKINIRKVALVILVILLCLSFFLIYKIGDYLGKQKAAKGLKIEDLNSEKKELSTYDATVHKLNDINTFFAIENCIQQYIYNINSEYQDIALQMLDKSFINEKKLDINNISSLKTSSEAHIFEAKEVFLKDEVEYKTYFVKGNIRESKKDYITATRKDVYFIVKFDMKNSTFSLIPIDNQKFETMKTGNIAASYGEKDIEKNKFNNIVYSSSDSKICERLLEDYKYKIINDTEYIYNCLSEEYKKSNYPNYNSFKSYVQKNKNKILNAKKEKYSAKKVEKDYIQYRVVDQDNKVYIFNITYPLEYTITFETFSAKK